MAKIKVHAGDFAKHGALFFGKQFTFMEPDKVWTKAKYDVSDVVDMDVANEESVKRIGGTVGWGVAGAALLGPVGLLAGLVLGGKKNEVTVVIKFNDDRKVMCTVDSKTYTAIQASMF